MRESTSPSTSPSTDLPSFTTVLITDSIMRNLDGDLGTYHELRIINKRNSWGLMEKKLRDEIEDIQPDFIYVHLGINDISDGTDTSEIMRRFVNFSSWADNKVPRSRLIVSYPLLTCDTEMNKGVLMLRELLSDWSVKFNTTDDVKDMRLHLNRNHNFQARLTMYDNSIKLVQAQDLFCERDGVHLSRSGKRVILGNFRHHVHDLTRRILNKPRRIPNPGGYSTRRS